MESSLVSSTNKVFITGLSALTASGNTLDDTWSNILDGNISIQEIANWEVNSLPVHIGGEVQNVSAKMLPDKKLKKVISKQDILGINAAQQAMKHSGLIDYQATLCSDEPDSVNNFRDRSGVYVGSPGNKYFQQYDFLPLIAKSNGDMQKFADNLFAEVHPMWLLRSLPNNVLAYVGITNNFKGANHNITNHAVSGAQAIIEAYHAIQAGQIDRACVVAYDLGTEPQALYYYDKLGLLSATSLKPFSNQHDGTVLAEGASAIIIESEESAKNRNATCFAELVGGDSSTECTGLFSIEEDGNELSKLMTKTLNKYQLSVDDFALLVAHGNGNPKSDISEALAINKTFTNNIPTTAFKWAMGHTLCASGILDTCLAVQSLNKRTLPGIANLESKSSQCQNLNISKEQQKINSDDKHALIINRGFAGMNACIIVKNCA